MPVPAAASLSNCRFVSMITRPGSTLVTMACSPPVSGAAGAGAGTAPLPGSEMPEPPDPGL